MREIITKNCTGEGLELVIGDQTNDQQLILLLNYQEINLFLQIYRLQQGLVQSHLLENPASKSGESFVAQIKDQRESVLECPLSPSIHVESGTAILTLNISGRLIPFVVFPEDFREIEDYYSAPPKESGENQLLDGIYWRDYTLS